MKQPSNYQEPGIAITREEVFLVDLVSSRFFENERLPLEEGTKRIGTMTTCDKRGSSRTMRGRESKRQNSKMESLNLERNSAHVQPTPTHGAWCTNWSQENAE